jgi:hypothetical protein
MQTYDVALWRYWPIYHLPVVDYVEAETPFLAVLSLMASHKLKHVARAAMLSKKFVERLSHGDKQHILALYSQHMWLYQH